MAGTAACWLAAAMVVAASRAVLGDVVIWPGCSKPYYATRLVQPGETDFDATVLLLENCRFFGRDIPFNSIQSNYPQLETASFSGTEMLGAPADLLQWVDLTVLYCSICSLHEIPPFITLPKFRRLVTLTLRNNIILKLDNPATFTNVANLRELDLAYNHIQSLHEEIFEPFHQIAQILLEFNKISNIPEKVFQNKASLGTINLSNNLIEYVYVDAFRGTGLTSLNLTGNRLTNLPEHFCSGFRSTTGVSLSEFFIDHNPWQCACLNELLHEMKSLNIKYQGDRYDGRHPVCITIDSFKCQRSDIRSLYDSISNSK